MVGISCGIKRLRPGFRLLSASSGLALPDMIKYIYGGLTVLLVVGAWLLWDQEAFIAWKEQAGPLPFFLALALLPAVGLPTTPFFLLAGAAFGPVTALIGCALAIALNLTLCYALAQSVMREWLERLLERYNKSIPEFSNKQAVSFILAVKFTPGVPTFIKNYLTALAGVPFALYLPLCWLITFAYAAGFVLLGDSFLDGDWVQAAGAIALLLICAASFLAWKRYKNAD